MLNYLKDEIFNSSKDTTSDDNKTKQKNMNITASSRNELETNFQTELAKFIKSISEKANAQFLYNLNTNIPSDITKPEDAVDQAIECGIVSAISEKSEWALEPSIQIAHRILEDVNAHSEAAALIAQAEKNNCNPFRK